MAQLKLLRRQPARWRLAMNPPEALADQWLARLELAPPFGGAIARPRAAPAERVVEASSALPPVDFAKVRSALSRVSVHGSVVTFDDPMAGTIVLARDEGSIVHQGSVAVRGPHGLTLEALRRRGLDETQARAVEFVAAWFGLPFDSLAADTAPSASVRWGFWPLRTADVARALLSWKEKAPVSFALCVGDAGIDVDAAPADSSAGPTWLAADPARKIVLRGDAALDCIVRDPRRLALLARAGRHPDARAAQIDVVVRESVQPLLSLSVPGSNGRTTIAEAARSARSLVALLLILRGVELEGVANVLSVAAADETRPLDEAPWLESVLAALRFGSRGAIGQAARRALSSPELQVEV
jgi:hypothetical protein